MEKKEAFVAIDFEHLTQNHETACAVGMVKVIRSVIVQEFYSLIKPAPDERAVINTRIHGITEEMCADAPTFAELLPWMEKFADGLPLVAHNNTEKTVLEKACRFYGLTESPLYQPELIDTYKITGKSLSASCEEYGIELKEHHNALEDARACAELYLKAKGSEIVKAEPKENKLRNDYPKEDKDLFKPLPDEEVRNKNTVFYHKHVVVTGKLFNSYPDRNVLLKEIKELGGRNTRSSTGVTSKTDIVILGEEAGENKIKAIEIHKSHLEIWDETKLIEVMKQIKEPESKELSLFPDETIKESPFTDRKVVVTGDFMAGRNNIVFQFKRLGADIEPNVTKNIHFVVIGSNPDASRMERLDKLIHDGYNIRKIYETELDAIFSGNWDDYFVDKEVKKDLNLTYEHYLKHHIGFENGRNVIASRELYLGKDFAGDIRLFDQITGNLGAFGSPGQIYPDTDICVLSNATIGKLKNGEKDETIHYIQDYYNKEKSIIFDFLFMSESDILNFCRERCESCGDEVTMDLYNRYIRSSSSQ